MIKEIGRALFKLNVHSSAITKNKIFCGYLTEHRAHFWTEDSSKHSVRRNHVKWFLMLPDEITEPVVGEEYLIVHGTWIHAGQISQDDPKKALIEGQLFPLTGLKFYKPLTWEKF